MKIDESGKSVPFHFESPRPQQMIQSIVYCVCDVFMPYHTPKGV